MRDLTTLRKLAEGREAEIYEWEDGTVLRLMRSSRGEEAVELQARALRAAHAAGVSVPEPSESVVVEGRHGLVMERIDGVDLLSLIARKPWSVWSAGTVTGRLQAELHDVRAPDDLPNLKERLTRRIEESELVPPEIATFALDLLGDLPDEDKLCHGDFHPGNIIQTDGRDVIIDWSNVSAGDPHADYARTDLMMKLGDPPPGSPILLRILAVVGRRLLRAAIGRSYRSHRSLDATLLRRWEIPVAAHRLSENIEPERPNLLRLLRERMGETG